jgi:hypothetical protein
MHTNEMKCLSKSFVAAAAIVFTGSSAAMAHPAEQAFVLLLPTYVYATAGTLAVA